MVPRCCRACAGAGVVPPVLSCPTVVLDPLLCPTVPPIPPPCTALEPSMPRTVPPSTPFGSCRLRLAKRP